MPEMRPSSGDTKQDSESRGGRRAMNQKFTCNHYAIEVDTGTQERKQQAALKLERPPWHRWCFS